METKNNKHFVLVHGACHGAWCWYKVVPLLKQAGHVVTALDLSASGINSKQIDELQSIHDYVQPLMQFVASLPQDERVILVGHSYGGFGISLAMENFPEKILAGIFVTAYMPDCVSPPATLAVEDLELAKMAVRPFKFLLQELATPESILSESKYGSVDRFYVVCKGDEVVSEEFQVWSIERNPPKATKVIDEAGHMPMFSKPKELALYLGAVADMY